MSIVWEERAGGHARAGKPQGLDLNSRAGTVSILALFGTAAVVLGVAAWWPDGAPSPRAAIAAPVENPPAPVAATAERVAAAEPAAPAEQPLPEGSARFALEAPADAAAGRFAGDDASAGNVMARNIIAKNWRPAGTRGLGIDAARTASIVASGTDDVAVAETEADVVKMEAELAAAGAGGFEAPAAPGMVAGRALKWVNLRTGPDNESEVIAVVPFDAALQAERDCPHWCAVTYDGKQGYIYKSFIGYDL